MIDKDGENQTACTMAVGIELPHNVRCFETPLSDVVVDRLSEP